MNKKAFGYGDLPIDYIAMLIIVLIIVIFFALYKIRDLQVGTEINSQMDALDSAIVLNNYLESETKFDDKKYTIAELVNRLSVDEPKTGTGPVINKLRQETLKYIKSYHAITGCPIAISYQIDNWNLRIDSSLKPNGACDVTHKYDATQRLPDMEGREIVVSLE